ncbi:hypothetical protein T492DRAFT_1129516 [Pavlovales sp. CCMP2436]|nr:hypothetical protein T492DRAFT_1129516 [Pavlovales sp. CCMP2436]
MTTRYFTDLPSLPSFTASFAMTSGSIVDVRNLQLLIPGTDRAYTVGTPARPWAEVYTNELVTDYVVVPDAKRIKTTSGPYATVGDYLENTTAVVAANLAQTQGSIAVTTAANQTNAQSIIDLQTKTDATNATIAALVPAPVAIVKCIQSDSWLVVTDNEYGTGDLQAHVSVASNNLYNALGDPVFTEMPAFVSASTITTSTDWPSSTGFSTAASTTNATGTEPWRAFDKLIRRLSLRFRGPTRVVLRDEDASPVFTSASTITPSTAWPASTAFLVTDSSRITGYEGWNAFASRRTGWKSASASYAATTQLGSESVTITYPTSILLYNYTIEALRIAGPVNWQVSGALEDDYFTVLASFTTTDNWTDNEIRQFTMPRTTTRFLKYKFTITKISASGTVTSVAIANIVADTATLGPAYLVSQGTIYPNPVFTSKSTIATGLVWPVSDGWSVLTNGNETSATQGYLAFDGINTSTASQWQSPLNAFSMQYPIATLLVSMTQSVVLGSSQLMMQEWYMSGSNDGGTFTTVQSYACPAWDSVMTFPITNAHIPYKSWRLTVTRRVETTQAQATQIWVRNMSFNTGCTTLRLRKRLPREYGPIQLFEHRRADQAELIAIAHIDEQLNRPGEPTKINMLPLFVRDAYHQSVRVQSSCVGLNIISCPGLAVIGITAIVPPVVACAMPESREGRSELTSKYLGPARSIDPSRTSVFPSGTTASKPLMPSTRLHDDFASSV